LLEQVDELAKPPGAPVFPAKQAISVRHDVDP
jgi:hypothetical protein